MRMISFGFQSRKKLNNLGEPPVSQAFYTYEERTHSEILTSSPTHQSTAQLLSMWLQAHFISKASLYFRFLTAQALLIQLSVKIMEVCLDCGLLLAQIFTLNTKDKQKVRSGTSRVELWKETWVQALQGGKAPHRRNREKLSFFQNTAGSQTAEMLGQQNPPQRYCSTIITRLPVRWWGTTVMPFCISCNFPWFCGILRMCPCFWPYKKGATGCSRGAVLEVNNLYPLQEPAWTGSWVIMADTQLLQLTQVNGFDGEHIHLHRRQEANDRFPRKGEKKAAKGQGLCFFPLKQ